MWSLPEETAEEVWKETVRLSKASNKPKSNVFGIRRSVLRSLRTSDDLMVIPIYRGNAKFFLDTDYSQIIMTLLGAPT
jgi:hypothetical protein